jgi:hypothetical protein
VAVALATSRSARADEVALPTLPPAYLVHEEQGFRFAYHPSTRDEVRALIDAALGIRDELRARLGRPVLELTRVHVAVSAVDLERVVPEGASRGKDAVVDAPSSLVAFELRPAPDVERAVELFRSGLAELALAETFGDRAPAWFRVGFVGGFAEPSSFARRRALFGVAMRSSAPRLDELDAALRTSNRAGDDAEAQAVELVRMLEASPSAFGRLMTAGAEGRRFEEAFSDAYRLELSALEDRLTRELSRHRAASWLGIAVVAFWLAVLAVHRGRARRRIAAASAKIEAEPVLVVAEIREAPSSKGKRARRRSVEPYESEVPRVSHDGRWHTLH